MSIYGAVMGELMMTYSKDGAFKQVPEIFLYIFFSIIIGIGLFCAVFSVRLYKNFMLRHAIKRQN
jgi:hypothetical protein